MLTFLLTPKTDALFYDLPVGLLFGVIANKSLQSLSEDTAADNCLFSSSLRRNSRRSVGAERGVVFCCLLLA